MAGIEAIREGASVVTGEGGDGDERAAWRFTSCSSIKLDIWDMVKYHRENKSQMALHDTSGRV